MDFAYVFLIIGILFVYILLLRKRPPRRDRGWVMLATKNQEHLYLRKLASFLEEQGVPTKVEIHKGSSRETWLHTKKILAKLYVQEGYQLKATRLVEKYEK